MNAKSLAGYGSIIMSLLTALAAAPYSLGEVATIIPPKWKERVFVAGAIATVILRIIRDNVAVVKDSFTTEVQSNPHTTNAGEHILIHYDLTVQNAQSEPPTPPKIEG